MAVLVPARWPGRSGPKNLRDLPGRAGSEVARLKGRQLEKNYTFFANFDIIIKSDFQYIYNFAVKFFNLGE